MSGGERLRGPKKPKENADRGHFGQELITTRLRLGLSQRGIAKYLGVHESLIAKIESGDRKPPRVLTFWENLATIPDIHPGEIQRLREYSGLPSEKPDIKSKNALLSEGAVSRAGIKFTFNLEVDPAQINMPQAELDALKNLFEATAAEGLAAYIRHRTRARSRLEKIFGADTTLYPNDKNHTE